MSEPFISEITMFGGNFAIPGWAYCAGQLLPISQNTAVFSLLGTTYGGNGETDFALPDLRGRIPMGSEDNSAGPGLPPIPLGSKRGTETQTLNVNNLPSHNHQVQLRCNAGKANRDTPTNNVPAVDAQALESFHSQTDNSTMAPGTVTGQTGGSQAFSVIQPDLGINFLIAITGTFPS